MIYVDTLRVYHVGTGGAEHRGKICTEDAIPVDEIMDSDEWCDWRRVNSEKVADPWQDPEYCVGIGVAWEAVPDRLPAGWVILVVKYEGHKSGPIGGR